MDDPPNSDEVNSPEPPPLPLTSEQVIMEKRIKGADGVWLQPTSEPPPPDPFAQLDSVDTGPPPPAPGPGSAESSGVSTSQDTTSSADTVE